jgi:hypothetical protein
VGDGGYNKSTYVPNVQQQQSDLNADDIQQMTYTQQPELHPVTQMVHEFSQEFQYGPWIVVILIASGVTHYSGIILGSILRKYGFRKQNRRKEDATDV